MAPTLSAAARYTGWSYAGRRETCTGPDGDAAAKLQTSLNRPDPARDRALHLSEGGNNLLRFPPHARRLPSRGPLASHAPSAWRSVERRPVSAWAAGLPTVVRSVRRLARLLYLARVSRTDM
jgi:hypothetical protein